MSEFSSFHHEGQNFKYQPEEEQIPTPGDGFNLEISAMVEDKLPEWFFKEIPWERAAERQLPEEALDALQYMARIEGNVCGGYLPIVLSSPVVRGSTEYTDNAAGGWAPEQNGHSIALYTFLDLYYGRESSSRLDDLDEKKQAVNLSMSGRIKSSILQIGANIQPETFFTAYSVIGYRNEVMTMRGYESLRTKMNEGSEHPVLSPMLYNIMKEEARHAQMYRKVAYDRLEGDEKMQRKMRKILAKYTGLVGEDFGGDEEADKIVRYLFEDANGRNLVKQVDKVIGSLPGLDGATPTQDRLASALKNRF